MPENPDQLIRTALQSWEEKVLGPAVARSHGQRAEYTTGSFEPVKPLYTPLDVDPHYLERSGFPGVYPFARGIQPTMYRGRFWAMRQYAGFGTARASNERYRYLLAQGQSGLSVAFDLPTQIGYDSDDPLADGEVGKVGVAIDTLAAVEEWARTDGHYIKDGDLPIVPIAQPGAAPVELSTPVPPPTPMTNEQTWWDLFFGEH